VQTAEIEYYEMKGQGLYITKVMVRGASIFVHEVQFTIVRLLLGVP